MAQILLNKFEKEKRVIELHLEGKTIRDIAKEVHLSFRDISKIIKEYNKKIKLEHKRENNNSQNRKLSKSSQSYQLFLNGNNPVKVAIDLNIDYIEIRKYWTEFLRLQNMKKLYYLFVDNEVHLDYLFKIYYFMLKNQIPSKECENILRVVHDITRLNQYHSNLKQEINTLEQKRNKLLYYNSGYS